MNSIEDVNHSYSLFLDLLRTLQRAEDEESAIHAVLDMVAGTFHPEKICYVPEEGPRNGIYGDCGVWTAGTRLLPDQVIKLLPSKKGFVLSLKSKGKRIGLLIMDGANDPSRMNSMIPLVMTIQDALDMALSNIRHTQELNESRAQLSQLSESLGVANKILRHDIANELMVINSSLELYKINNRERDILRAQASLQRMQSIISQMRDLDNFLLSRSDMTVTSLANIVGKVLPSLDMPFTLRGEAMVLADPALVAIIENLVRNAKKHGQAKSLEFSIHQDGGKATLGVRDDGIGIPPDQLDRIFMEGVAYGESKGTGLGLYLVRRTMERYGGSISVSNDRRSGARFEMTFRVADHQ